MIGDAIGAAIGTDCELEPSAVRRCLRTSLSRRRYPVLNQLNGLKVLIDHACLSQDEVDRKEEICGDVEHLVRLSRHFDSPLHFTPQQLGTTLAQVFILRSEILDTLDLQPWNTAIQQLYLSEQMFTLRQGYYESIRGLYYLYDDFNDRTIHCNQALQMASAEATAFFIRVLEAFGNIDSFRP